MFSQKLNKLSEEFKRKGYELKKDSEGCTVSKENFYHVRIDDYLLIDAPTDYIVDLVEHEFEKLKSES